jgi:hypothetical protein
MDYQIIPFKNARPTGDVDMWKDYLLDPVKDHARQVVEMGLADRVEVRDTNEKLVFQWPRTVSVPPTSSLSD